MASPSRLHHLGAAVPSLPWICIAGALFACFSAVAAMDDRFAYDVNVIDMPVPALVALLCVAGGIYLLLPRLIRTTRPVSASAAVCLVAWIVIAGLAMRVVFLGTQPILEDDYNRYLLDGAVTAHGISPYRHSPQAILDGMTGNRTLDAIALDATPVLERINYPGLTTVYPPIAQAAFALAHWLAPWNLDAWRALLLVCDLAVLGLILVLLGATGRPLSWGALYWWNPVVIKEFHNSAHMDLLVMLAVVTALVLLIRARPYLAAGALALAIATKIWPVLLVPTLLRSRIVMPRVALAAAAIGAVVAAALLLPMVWSGLNEFSGLYAYTSRWQANDLLFRAIEWVAVGLSSVAGWESSAGQFIARGCVAALLVALSLYLNRTSATSAQQTCYRAFITIGALLLLSPTQFPWYYGWLAVLLPLFPVRGFLVLAATLPLYYSYFHFAARDLPDLFRYGIVLVIWMPALVLLIIDRRCDQLVRNAVKL